MCRMIFFIAPIPPFQRGEQTKALLAALFLKENSFLLIDEPTNHLDTLGRKTLSDYLKENMGLFWFLMTGFS